MAYLFDTDVLTLLFRGGDEYPALQRRIRETPHNEKWISAVTVEEIMRGALALIRSEETRRAGTEGYRLLTELLQFLAAFPVLPLDDAANEKYQAMPAEVKRNGRADCKIAASAIVHGLTVVTRNLRHFEAIPDVTCEDWTQQ